MLLAANKTRLTLTRASRSLSAEAFFHILFSFICSLKLNYQFTDSNLKKKYIKNCSFRLERRQTLPAPVAVNPFINPYDAELFCINHGHERFFNQFEIIINV